MIVPLAGVCKTTSVAIVKLEQSYRIMIRTEGRYWLPISPEGPFPKWSESSGFQLKGAGTVTNGTLRFIIGKDAVSFGSKYTSGYIAINVKSKSLEVRADLSSQHSKEINHSGFYKTCTFDIPVIVSVTEYEQLDALKGKFIKISGQLQDNWHCKINSGAVLLSNWYEAGPTYTFIGWVDNGYGPDKYELKVWEMRTNK